MHTPQEAFPGARISTNVPLDILMFEHAMLIIAGTARSMGVETDL